jgi:hypothetical protein
MGVQDTGDSRQRLDTACPNVSDNGAQVSFAFAA